MKLAGLLIVLLIVTVAGCASDRNEQHPMDSLWKEGYGYNNPNAERIRNGEKPVGFAE